MKRIFTFLLAVMFTSFAFAQKPTDVIKKTETKPVIDGVMDEGIWDEATVNAVDKPYTGETPTLGASGETNWRALWDDDGVYVLVTVTDDVYLPRYTGTGNAWEYDHVEIYFDTNFILEDGQGPQTDGNGLGNGHYQFADDITAGIDDGTMQTRADGVQFAVLADGTNYVEEYFIPFTKLKTGAGAMMDKTQDIGFDVTVIDNDASATPNVPLRNRAVWSNDGSVVSESWVNMDEAGTITLEGAEAGILIDEITIAVEGDITEDDQTLQVMVTELLPVGVTDSTVVWYLEVPEGSTARATISNDGVITPVIDGEVEVYAMSPDGIAESNHITVNISGQVVTLMELNLIRNGDFNQVNENGTATFWGGWGGDAGTPLPQVVDGVAVATPVQAANVWQYQFNQENLNAIPNIPYVFKFKAWADAPRSINVDFEDIEANGHNRYGSTTDERSANGRSDWTFDVTMEPTWYEFDVIFDQIVPTTVQKVQFMLAAAGEVTYIDSVILISEADMALLPTSVNDINRESFRVYPNPAVSALYVELPAANTRVTVYNILGVKMEDVIVPGTRHQFDVRNYKKGVYFVKTKDSVVKFVK